MPKDNWKKQTLWSLPVYTGDVSGVCSALYELGGMVVMHDPSGCNSTYNTHDEIRWVKQESLIFLSGLTQLDAITGNDQKLIDDIVTSVHEFHPAFVAIANSPVPWLIGTDFSAICQKVTRETGIPAFYIETNAMHDYTRGAGLAFLELAKMLFSDLVNEKTAGIAPHKGMIQETETDEQSGQSVRADVSIQPGVSWQSGAVRYQGASDRKIRVNILGVTPLDYTVMSQIDTLRAILQKEGFEVVSVWGMGDDLEDLKRADRADVNLVLSSVGIYAAKWMEENQGIPFVASVPVGAFAKNVFKALKDTARNLVSCVPYLSVLGQEKNGQGLADECFAGEPVTMGSLAADQVLSRGEKIDLIPLTETIEGLVPQNTAMPKGEQQIAETLGRYRKVTADPMLDSVCRTDCQFTGKPHFALSGRLYLNEINPLITDS